MTELTYTVFDMETTGLNPSEGDEILSIGAIRIVNCRLLREERFEQLVDPLRTIPWESVQIHGIHPEMLIGQPTIDKVLPGFQQFVENTILVAKISILKQAWGVSDSACWLLRFCFLS